MPSRRGQPKGDKRERTRARLLDAASEVIGEVGFEATSLEAVARRAGMSRGAIYGNFRDRDELFLAVVERRWRPVAPEVEPGAGYAERMQLLGEALIQALPSRRASAVGAASFGLYALTHPQMRERLVQANADAYRRTLNAIMISGGDADLPMPPEDFVRMLHAVTEGLTMLANLTPELITAETIRRTFDALARIA